MKEKYGEDLTLVGITGYASISEINDFIDRYGLNEIPHIIDTNGSNIWSAFEVYSQPWWSLVRIDGSVESKYGTFPPEIVEEASL